MKVSGKPIDGGFVTRLSLGAGALKAAATMAQQQQQGIGGPGGRPGQLRQVPAERAPAGARLFPGPTRLRHAEAREKPSRASACSFVRPRSTESLFFLVFFTIHSPTPQAVP